MEKRPAYTWKNVGSIPTSSTKMSKKLTFAEACELARENARKHDQAWQDYWAKENPPKSFAEAIEDLNQAFSDLKSAVWRELTPVLQTCIDMVQYAYEYVCKSFGIRS